MFLIRASAKKTAGQLSRGLQNHSQLSLPMAAHSAMKSAAKTSSESATESTMESDATTEPATAKSKARTETRPKPAAYKARPIEPTADEDREPAVVIRISVAVRRIAVDISRRINRLLLIRINIRRRRLRLHRIGRINRRILRIHRSLRLIRPIRHHRQITRRLREQCMQLARQRILNLEQINERARRLQRSDHAPAIHIHHLPGHTQLIIRILISA